MTEFHGQLDTVADGGIFLTSDGHIYYLGRLTKVDQGEYESIIAISGGRQPGPGTPVHIVDHDDKSIMYTEWTQTRQPTAAELKSSEHFFSTSLLGLSLVRLTDGRVFDIEPGYDYAVEIHEGNLLDIIVHAAYVWIVQAQNIVDWLDDPDVRSMDDLEGEAKSD